MGAILAVFIFAATTPQTSTNTVLSLVNFEDCSGGDPSAVVSRCECGPSLQGNSLADILGEEGRPIAIDEGAELTLELQEKGGFGGIFHARAWQDVRRILPRPYTKTRSRQ